jgi:hypothetical protein
MVSGRAADPRRRTLTRLLAAPGVLSGLVLLARPGRVVGRLCPEFPRSRLPLVRLLGVRLLAQHTAVLLEPHPVLVRAGSAIDLLHAATMVPFVASPRYGRAARISGALAAGYAAVSMAVAPR